jgi:hypothetical protein
MLLQRPDQLADAQLGSQLDFGEPALHLFVVALLYEEVSRVGAAAFPEASHYPDDFL